MEYEKIKQLMEDMGNSKLTAIDIDFPDGTKISMKKEATTVDKKENTKIQNDKLMNSETENLEIKQNEEEKTGNIIKSPMVGTFYLKPSPTSKPYIEIGKQVKKGETICIIEAMYRSYAVPRPGRSYRIRFL